MSGFPRKFSKIIAAVAAIGGAMAAGAGPLSPGFGGTTLPTCDDGYSAATPIGFTADFFGTNYGSLYVSNNGYVTFGAGQGIYTPTGLTASYNGNPIIAPFYADVDTRGIGTVTYGSGTFGGDKAFGVTWNNVGYYAKGTDKTNTFQMLLVDRPDLGTGDFAIIFNYGQVKWEAGIASGGVNGFGGTSAAVGYAKGSGASGTYYQLPGSLRNGALLNGGSNSLVGGSNDGTPGQYEFLVENGAVIQPSQPPPPPPPPPPPAPPPPLPPAPTAAPEVDPASAAAAATLLLGSLIVMRGRRRS